MIEHMDRAVRPSLFDVYAEPDLVWTIVLANLMSPFLWDLSETVKARGGTDGIDNLHHYVDSHFTHIGSLDIAKQNGVFDLSEERERLGADIVDGALENILGVMRRRQREGMLPPKADVRQLINDGVFPSYFYATIDEARAYRRLMGRKKHKPIGVTCCLDEAALIVALICTLQRTVPDHLTIIGSPAHYAAFFAEGDGAWWFDGKHDYFSRSQWRAVIEADAQTRGQHEFDGRLPGIEWILSPLGNYRMKDKTSSIPEMSLRPIVANLTDFFGSGIQQIIDANRLDSMQYTRSSLAEPLSALFPTDGANAIRARVREIARDNPNSLEAAALYCFRDLEVPEPQHYLTTALRSQQTRQFEAGIAGVDDAIDVVRKVEGTESVLGSRDRLAMPDEVLHFNSGTDRDRALLLYTLLQRGAGISESAKCEAEILFTAERSFVRGPGFLVDAATHSQSDHMDGPVQLRLALTD